MAINRDAFARDCVAKGMFFGVNPHYLVAVAEHRSGISDDTQNNLVGPFRLTQEVWDAGGTDNALNVALEPAQINGFRRQCTFAGLNAKRAQDRLFEQLERFPSVLELYREQFGDEPDLANKLQSALNATAPLIDPAVEAELEEKLEDSPVVDDTETPAPLPPTKSNKPIPKGAQGVFEVKAPWIMAKLIDDFGFTEIQAAGILGNIGHECDGFRLFQEVRPIGGGLGGWGWCQWTGVRRTAFNDFCQRQGLSRTSDAANYGFLRLELRTTHASAVTRVKGTATLKQAVREFEDAFEKAHPNHKHFPSRDRWAQKALDSFKRAVPAQIAALLDENLVAVVTAKAKSGNTTFWLIDQYAEEGNQLLIKEVAGEAPQVLKSDDTVFPLEPGLVPAAVASVLNQHAPGPGDPHPDTPVQPPQTDPEISERLFAEAKRCDERLVSRNVPGTNRGRLACAWAVNEVARRALGKAIGGGLSTANMAQVLRAKHQALAENAIVPGAIVISPTQGRNVGHVGIVGQIQSPASKTLIYSNSSSRAVFSHHFTLGKWKSFYNGTNKKLPVLFFAIKK